MRILRVALLAGLAAMTALLLACGDDDDETADGGGVVETDAPTEASGDDAGDNAFTIVTENTAFDPAEFTIPAETDVVFDFENRDAREHTFTVYTDAEFTQMQGTTVPLAAEGVDTSFGNYPAGEYFFRCELHPAQMQGTFTAE